MSGYRGIRPKLTYESVTHPKRQQQGAWLKKDEGMEAALFAGEEMRVARIEFGSTFKLSYLGMSHPTNFRSLEEAREVAPDFARAVLLTMIAMVGIPQEETTLRGALAACAGRAQTTRRERVFMRDMGGANEKHNQAA